MRTHQIAERFANEIHAGLTVLHEGDSTGVIEEFVDHELDAVCVDGDHSYEGVKRNITAAKRKIHHDGLLIFNDYPYWSPMECMPYGVMQAVNELYVAEGWRAAYLALDGYMYCDIAIRRI